MHSLTQGHRTSPLYAARCWLRPWRPEVTVAVHRGQGAQCECNFCTRCSTRPSALRPSAPALALAPGVLPASRRCQLEGPRLRVPLTPAPPPRPGSLHSRSVGRRGPRRLPATRGQGVDGQLSPGPASLSLHKRAGSDFMRLLQSTRALARSPSLGGRILALGIQAQISHMRVSSRPKRSPRVTRAETALKLAS